MVEKTDEILPDTGVIPGRFQIFHNDHLRYLLAACRLCRHLVVGITNPDPRLTRQDAADPRRTLPLANPLTYYERYRMVEAVLTEAGCCPASFSIVPLPINFPELYRYYVPESALYFVSIYDDWGRRKLELFKSLGLQTRVLWEVAPEEKGISAQDVRQRLISGEPWQHLVPSAAVRLVQQWDIAGRLRRMAAADNPEG